jgi:hypothetical protein
MPMHQKSFFPLDVLRNSELVNEFRFTQGVPLLKVPGRRNAGGQSVGHIGQGGGYEDTTTVLYDLSVDPGQLTAAADPENEARLVALMRHLMIQNEAPPEAFIRLGLEPK